MNSSDIDEWREKRYAVNKVGTPTWNVAYHLQTQRRRKKSANAFSGKEVQHS